MPWSPAPERKSIILSNQNRRPRYFCCCVAASIYACFFSLIGNVSTTQAKPPRWSAAPLEQSVSIRDGRTDARLSWSDFLAKIQSADAVFLGESHTDEATHRFQLAVYQELLAAKQQKVVLAMEMFERDEQASLDAYLAGEIDEDAFLAKVKPWANYHEAYRPLIEQAKTAGVPAVAANFPTALRRQLARNGAKALDALTEDEKKLVPKKYLPNSPVYWKRTDNAIRGHQGMMPVDPDNERLYSTQSLWDNSMGEACADALDKYPGHSVLHLNGKFHTAYWDGTAAQLRKRKPNATIKTVTITPTRNPTTAKLQGKSIADFVVFVEALATNINDGKRSVQVSGSLSYRLHLPKKAKQQAKTPLLVWLADDGLSAEESMSLCKKQYGEFAAIAVVEAPHQAIGADFTKGGRWYWPDSFAGDTLSMVHGVEEICSYLLRHYDVLDPERICVVGEGTGATVAAVIGSQADRLPFTVLAIEPRQYSKIKDLPLPLPDFFGDDPPAAKTLQVLAKAAQEDWWQSEIKQYNSVQVPSEFRTTATDPWELELQKTNAIRRALGVAEAARVTDGAKRFLLVEKHSPRARHWGRLQALANVQADGGAAVVVTEVPAGDGAERIGTVISAAAAMKPGVLPRCPGPFGGTTVIVLPAGTDSADVAQWLEIEADDPLQAASRFHRVRIATGNGDRALPLLLTKLHGENRKNILIVPATFYADLGGLRTLVESVREHEDEMTLHWLPGLGGRPGILDAAD